MTDLLLGEKGASPKAHDLIARYFQAVVAYHGEAHHDFEDTQSRAIALGERDGDLAEYITSLESSVCSLSSELSRVKEANDEFIRQFGEIWSARSAVPTREGEK